MSCERLRKLSCLFPSVTEGIYSICVRVSLEVGGGDGWCVCVCVGGQEGGDEEEGLITHTHGPPIRRASGGESR